MIIWLKELEFSSTNLAQTLKQGVADPWLVLDNRITWYGMCRLVLCTKIKNKLDEECLIGVFHFCS